VGSNPTLSAIPIISYLVNLISFGVCRGGCDLNVASQPLGKENLVATKKPLFMGHLGVAIEKSPSLAACMGESVPLSPTHFVQFGIGKSGAAATETLTGRPEPSTLALLAAGLFGLLGFARRKLNASPQTSSDSRSSGGIPERRFRDKRST
jgi:hypothetical protein